MERTSQLQWPPHLEDPTGNRQRKPRTSGQTMVIDKGLGLHSFEDLLQTSAEHIDVIKLGFGTAPLYPPNLLRQKINMATAYGVGVMPGGTFLEVAVYHKMGEQFLHAAAELGFSSIEVSDGSIDMDRRLRSDLIRKGLENGLTVYTEYGKKSFGSQIEIDSLLETIQVDLACGAAMVTVEGRESGTGVGVYDAEGKCKDEQIQDVIERLDDPTKIMWETPQKSQQVYFLKMLGSKVNLGNILPHDIMSLEALRRGLRSDTFITT